jgi:hypothetical protein
MRSCINRLFIGESFRPDVAEQGGWKARESRVRPRSMAAPVYALVNRSHLAKDIDPHQNAVLGHY